MEFEKLLKLAADKAVEMGTRNKTDEEMIKKIVADALVAQKKSSIRKGAFAAPDDKDEDKKGFTDLEKRIVLPAKSDVDREIQRWNDDVYLTSQLMKADPRSLKMYDEFTQQSAYTELAKAMSTDSSSAQGYEWIPTGFSANVVEQVRLQLKVANLFQTITMPTNPYVFPVASSDATGYLQSESLANDATKLRASTPGTTNLTLQAKKLAARVLFSEEIVEDSIVPILPWLKNNVATAIAIAEEKAVINGDASGTVSGSHMDSNVTAVYDAQAAWDGLRHSAQAAAKADISTLTVENLRAIRQKMGKYGIDPSKLVWIVGMAGYIKLLSLKDANSNPVFNTLEKYGPNATVITGELGKMDGSPVVVSEYIYENLNASGVYEAGSAKTIMLCVYTPAFLIGDRRRITVKTAENIETDQQILVTTERKDFKSFYIVTSNYVVGLGIGLTV